MEHGHRAQGYAGHAGAPELCGTMKAIRIGLRLSSWSVTRQVLVASPYPSSDGGQFQAHGWHAGRIESAFANPKLIY